MYGDTDAPDEGGRGRMIRFTYHLPDELDPRQLHRDFKTMGVLESDYEYLLTKQGWRLIVTDGDQSFRAETVLKIRRIPFESSVGVSG